MSVNYSDRGVKFVPSGEIKGGQRSKSVTLYYDVLRTKLCVVILKICLDLNMNW